jgi:glycosyltransferase involved in cell wall biosynthesis
MQNHHCMRWLFRKQVASNKEEARRHYNAKDYKKAEPFLDEMLKENPNDAWALDVLSRLYMNTSRHVQSVELIRRMLSTNPDADLIRRLIHAGCVTNDAESVFRFSNQIDWKKSDEDLLSKIYDAFWPDQRCVDFFSETKWNSEIPFPIYVQAEQLYEDGKVVQAIELLTSLVSRDVVNESTLMLARKICVSLGQVEMAHDLWANYLRHIDGELSRKRSLAKRLLSSKRYEEAFEIATMVLEENPEDIQMLSSLTEIGQYVEQPLGALHAYHRLDSIGEAKLYHLRRFANIAIKAGSIDDILLAVQRLVKLEVDANATVRNAYIKLCDMQEHDKAEKVLELIQDSLLEIDLKAAKALEEGDPGLAISILDEGLIESPEQVSFLMRKAIALEAMGELSDAISMFDKVLVLKPKHHSATQRRLKCGLKIWPEEKYFTEITQATLQFPQNINHQFARLNYVLSVSRDYELALEIVRTCLHHHPDHQRSHLYLALVHSWLGEHEAARSSISKSMVRWPTSNDVFITASQVEKNAGDTTKQLEHINTMLGLHALQPVHSSSPIGAITPEYLSTASTTTVQDSRLVSIIMTTYKRDPLLDAAIASIMNQTYQNIELVIVDDCSPDNNFSYLQELAENESRIRVFQMSENGGTYLAKNFGMTQAKGEFIGFMDSDDYCHAQRIEYQVASLDAHPEVMGVTHDYFRIDESSDIEFRGIGALRMACISLLIRREVVDEIGFFDSLRVGADTEYIERIEAYYGKDCRLRHQIPSMFMMLHSSSLTGGGPFHISWRSVTGPRLQHHRSFRTWHKKIKAKLEDPFVSRKIHLRPFEVPEEMKSTHYQWEEGMPLFSEMIKKRNHDWWKGKKPVWQKKLSPKLAGRDYVEQLGMKVPKLYWKGEDVEEMPLFNQLPNKFVLKPEKGWSSNNVYCMKDGEDILTHKSYDREALVAALVNDKFVAENKPTIMIEELLEPEEKQRSDGLPRDFKFYCFGDEIAMVHVALLKSEIYKEKNEHHYYTPDFRIIGQRIMDNRKQGTVPIERPDCWDEMVTTVRAIGRELGIYMRIDMFATTRGAVFGEFTPTPHGGGGYSEFADKYLGSFWKGEEGVE